MIKQFLRRYLLEVLVCVALILILLAGLALGNIAGPRANVAPAQSQMACVLIILPPCI